jgi:hypothetical protein
MAATIHIRNVPDALHRRLKSCGTLAGKSLADDPVDEIRFVAGRPTIEELPARLERESTTHLSISPAETVRAEHGR